jgi:hypothetical protein
MKWTILGGGSTDGGRGAYVHAKRTVDGSHSTFMVEHDAGLAPYAAFLLHERTRAAADATSPVPVQTEPGTLCSPNALTRAETVALGALSAFPAGTATNVTRQAVDQAVAAAFRDAPCRGLEYAGEQARFVYAGIEAVAAHARGPLDTTQGGGQARRAASRRAEIGRQIKGDAAR